MTNETCWYWLKINIDQGFVAQIWAIKTVSPSLYYEDAIDALVPCLAKIRKDLAIPTK